MSSFTLNYAGSGASPLMLVEMLIDAAQEAAWRAQEKRAAQARARSKPRKPSLTLRPGPDTPLWNELARQIRPHLRTYGTKAQLARLLGISRQRMQVCLKANSACLDAERTLLLVGWLGFFQRGGRIVSVVRPGRRRPGRGAAVVPGNV